MPGKDIKKLLESKYREYCIPEFIESDPVQIPHLFAERRNVEIAAFLTCTIAWGQRPTIIKNARRIMKLMDDRPFEFITSCERGDTLHFNSFCHRTFNADDLRDFVTGLQKIIHKYGSIGDMFMKLFRDHGDIYSVLKGFYNEFSSHFQNHHSKKHVSNVSTNSAAKRLNLFLMWLVRNDDAGIHFGLWDFIPKSKLMIPLDVHVGNVSRQLELLDRKQNDWKSVAELTEKLAIFDKEDPVRYDFALFGLGISNKDARKKLIDIQK